MDEHTTESAQRQWPWWHHHTMRNLSSGSTHRYCVGGWRKKGKWVSCPHTDEKAGKGLRW